MLSKSIVALILLWTQLLWSQDIAPEHLRLHLKFDNEQLIDKSIFEHTIINHETEFRPGLSNEALYFPGNQSYLEVSFNENLKIENVITTSLWYHHKDQENNGYYSLIEQSSDEFEGHSRYGTWIYDKRKLLTCIEPNVCPNSSVLCQRCHSADLEMKEGKWYHIVSQYDGKFLKFFINGVLNNAREYLTSTGISTRPVSLTLGTDVFDPNPQYLKGLMDEVKIFDVVLNDDQILDLYQEFSAVNVHNSLNDQIILFPNPVSDFLYLSDSAAGRKVQIYDLLGKKVKFLKAIVNKAIDLRDLEEGIFFLQLEGHEKAIKFFIER